MFRSILACLFLAPIISQAAVVKGPPLYYAGLFTEPNPKTKSYNNGSVVEIKWKTIYNSSNLYLVGGKDFRYSVPLSCGSSFLSPLDYFTNSEPVKSKQYEKFLLLDSLIEYHYGS